MLPTVLLPISFSGSRKSTIGSRAVLANKPEIDIPIPGQIMPPRNSVLRDDVEVDRGAQIDHDARPAVFVKPATAFTSRSAPTSRGLS